MMAAGSVLLAAGADELLDAYSRHGIQKDQRWVFQLHACVQIDLPENE